MRERIYSSRILEKKIDRDWLISHLNNVQDISIIITRQHFLKLVRRYGVNEFMRRFKSRCPSLVVHSKVSQMSGSMEQLILGELHVINNLIDKLEKRKNENGSQL